jgi:predicted nucleic acid-binding protein
MVDSGPLGQLAHPHRQADIDQWMKSLLSAGIQIMIPEVADYEVRRNLLLSGLHDAVMELNDLRRTLTFRPINTSVMLRAAELWADAWRGGRPTADPKELDADVIIAAQALEVDAIVATSNVAHLSRYVTAKDWRLIRHP